ncbi:MAG: lysoplasmalogenase [Novosphingobium sp.]
MPKRALIEHRPFLLSAIALALAYFLLRDSALGGVWLMLLKGAGVACLALYAFLRYHGVDARWLGFALVCFALGDAAGQVWPYPALLLAFLGMVLYLGLFLRNPRRNPASSQKGAAVALLVMTPLLFWLLSGGNMQAAIYGLTLGAMAGAAWMSRFPRYRVGTGAVLIVAAGLLGAASMSAGVLAWWLGWPLYFIGQFLICTGTIQQLKREHRA